MDWEGGDLLLDAAERESLEVFVTGDNTIQYEQNIAGRKLAVLSLSTNNWPIIKNYVDRIAAAIDVAQSRGERPKLQDAKYGENSSARPLSPLPSHHSENRPAAL
jgi:hypothetical protein